mmetsp:Transcript_72/g.107  ORF Transcript_72/g.107 Transcript_72/m.107 type:complete len:95 (-) Transcript_72:191-475(-)
MYMKSIVSEEIIPVMPACMTKNTAKPFGPQLFSSRAAKRASIGSASKAFSNEVSVKWDVTTFQMYQCDSPVFAGTMTSSDVVSVRSPWGFAANS